MYYVPVTFLDKIISTYYTDQRICWQVLPFIPDTPELDEKFFVPEMKHNYLNFDNFVYGLSDPETFDLSPNIYCTVSIRCIFGTGTQIFNFSLDYRILKQR